MLKIEREHFVKPENKDSAYKDQPSPIGWNISLSAPHMHAIALEELKDKAKIANRVLVVGTGGGYMAACFGELSKNSEIYQID